MTPSRVPVRRTQAQRRHETRARLEDATIRLLASEGYSGTTIAAVAEAAGVSRGATLHYYPQKLDLVANVLADRVRAAMDEMPARVSRVNGDWIAALDLLHNGFRTEMAQALFTAQLRARVDPQLRARVEPSWELFVTTIDELCEPLFGPAIAALPVRACLLRFVVTTIRGIVMLDMMGDHADTGQWLFGRDQMFALLDHHCQMAANY